MSGTVEFSSSALSRTFPERWGTPAGSAGSEVRQRWIANQIRLDEARDPGVRQRRLNRARLQQLELEAEGLLYLATSHMREEGR